DGVDEAPAPVVGGGVGLVAGTVDEGDAGVGVDGGSCQGQQDGQENAHWFPPRGRAIGRAGAPWPALGPRATPAAPYAGVRGRSLPQSVTQFKRLFAGRPVRPPARGSGPGRTGSPGPRRSPV